MNETDKNLQDLKKAWNIGNKNKNFEWVFMPKEEKDYFKKCCELMYKKTKK